MKQRWTAAKRLTSAMEGSLVLKVSGRTEPMVCHPRALNFRISWNPMPRLAPGTFEISSEPWTKNITGDDLPTTSTVFIAFEVLSCCLRECFNRLNWPKNESKHFSDFLLSRLENEAVVNEMWRKNPKVGIAILAYWFWCHPSHMQVANNVKVY